MSGSGCTCAARARRWSATAPCVGCGVWPLESQLTPVLLQILSAAGSGLVLWRNNSGLDTHWPDGRRRVRPIKYGIGPGGADWIGMYRRPSGGPALYVEAELKSHSGTQSPPQRLHQALVERGGGVYAVVRSEAEARALLERLAIAA